MLSSIHQYTLGTPYTLNSVTCHSKSFSISSQLDITNAIAFSNDGTKLYVVGYTTSPSSIGRIGQYKLSSAFDISTATFDDLLTIDFQVSLNERGLAFNDDGTRFFVIESAAFSDEIHQYSAS